MRIIVFIISAIILASCTQTAPEYTGELQVCKVDPDNSNSNQGIAFGQIENEGLSGNKSILLDVKNVYGLGTKFTKWIPNQDYVATVWRKKGMGKAKLAIHGEWGLYRETSKAIKDSLEWEQLSLQFRTPDSNGITLKVYAYGNQQERNLVDLLEIKKATTPNKHEDYPLYSLTLDHKEYTTLIGHKNKANSIGLSYKKDKFYLPATMNIDGEEQAIKVQLRGSSKGNWLRKKMSLSIKPTTPVNEAKRFALITPNHQNFVVPYYANKIAEALNLPYSRQELAQVHINNEDFGMYIWEEKIHQAFLDRLGINGFVIRYKDNVINNIYYGSQIAFHDVANLKPAKNAQQEKAYGMFHELMEYIRNKELERAIDLIDLDAWAKYGAYKMIVGGSHDQMFRNQYIYFNFDKGVFAPIVRSEGDLEKLQYRHGSFLTSLNDYQYLNLENDWINRLLIDLEEDGEYVQAKLKYVKLIVDQKKQFINDFEQFIVKHGKHLKNDPYGIHSIGEQHQLINALHGIAEHNLNKLEEYLQESIVYCSILKGINRTEVQIIPDTEIPFQFTQFDTHGNYPYLLKKNGVRLRSGNTNQLVNDFKHLVFSIDHEEFHTKRTVYSIEIKGNIKNIDIKAINSVTGEELTGSKLNITRAKMY